ncbi:MAG: hypothetical protein IPL61_13050 [Myxococcales bacterium]|nr:hypothetical protein [Myxococcales bacterium]
MRAARDDTTELAVPSVAPFLRRRHRAARRGVVLTGALTLATGGLALFLILAVSAFVALPLLASTMVGLNACLHAHAISAGLARARALAAAPDATAHRVSGRTLELCGGDGLVRIDAPGLDEFLARTAARPAELPAARVIER